MDIKMIYKEKNCNVLSKCLLLFIALAFYSFSCFAQISSTVPSSCNDTSAKVQIIKNFTILYPNFITRTKDNNIIIPSGYTDDFVSNKIKALLTKISPTGNIAWQKQTTYKTSGNYDFYRAIETTTGDIFAIGDFDQTDINGNVAYSDVLVSRLNGNGVPVATNGFKDKTWSSNIINGGYFKINDLAEGPDGGIYLTGYAYDATNGGVIAVILRLDQNPGLNWSQYFRPNGPGSNFSSGYGIGFTPNGNIVLTGGYPIGYAPDKTFFTVELSPFNGDTLSTNFWRVTGADSVLSAFYNPINPASVTRLNNGNIAVFGSVAGDGSLVGGKTKYGAMAEFDVQQNFVKGWQVTGNYVSNKTDTKMYVHPDGSADITFNNNLVSDSINLFVAHIEGDTLQKQRVIKQKKLSIHSFKNFAKMDDGGSVAVEQDYDNLSSYNLYFFHNTDTPNIYLGKDTSVMQIEPLSYRRIPNQGMTIIKNPISFDVNIQTSLNYIDDTLKRDTIVMLNSTCSGIKVASTKKTLCIGDQTIIYASKNKECQLPVSWGFDTSVVNYNFITDTSVSLIFKKRWQGYVKASTCASVADSVLITALQSPGPVELGPDEVLCPGNTIKLNATNKYQFYKWQDGSTDSTLTVSALGKYTVTVTDSCGNVFSDFINVISPAAANFSLGNDTTKCNNDTITLRLPSNFNNYNWQPPYNIILVNDSTAKVFPAVDTSYMVSADKGAGCLFFDTIKIKTAASPPINLGKDTIACTGAIIPLDAGSGFSSYMWSSGSSAQKINVSSSGQYVVMAMAANGCTSVDSINITISPLPNPELGKDTIICEKNFVLNPGSFAAYLWQDGSTAPTYTPLIVGLYKVTVWDANNCANADSVNILGINPSPQNFLPADTASFCNGESVTLATDSIYNAYLWNTGNTTPSITVNSPGIYWLRATNNYGCSTSDSVTVSVRICVNDIFFPTGFSPNGDGKNDFFRPTVYGIIDKYNLVIYNRFGQKLFETNNPAIGWNGYINGQPPQAGTTYIWYANYQLTGKAPEIRKGTITVVR